MRVIDAIEISFNNGYRKAVEGIFLDLTKSIEDLYNKHIFCSTDLSDTEKEAVMDFSNDLCFIIDELKEKFKEIRK